MKTKRTTIRKEVAIRIDIIAVFTYSSRMVVVVAADIHRRQLAKLCSTNQLNDSGLKNHRLPSEEPRNSLKSQILLNSAVWFSFQEFSMSHFANELAIFGGNLTPRYCEVWISSQFPSFIWAPITVRLQVIRV